MVQVLQIIVSLVAIIVIAVCLLKRIFKDEYISFINVFLLMLLADVFIPAFIGAISGNYLSYRYFAQLSSSEYFLSLLIHTLFLVLFFIGWRIRIRSGSSMTVLKKYVPVKPEYTVSEVALLIIFLGSIFIQVAKLYIEFRACGSWEVFYDFKITRAYLMPIKYDTFFEKVINLASELCFTTLFMTVAIGLTYAKKLKGKVFWLYFAPVIALVLTLTTMYRGSIVAFLCVIIVTIQIVYKGKLSSKIRKGIIGGGVVAVVLFLAYGAIRTNLNMQKWGTEQTLLESLGSMLSNTLGNSLSALARCINYLNNGGEIFWGQSIYEMIASVIPRSIWLEKPVRYGVITLTTAMGSPISTMDAVTIPGELLMNFGFMGVLVFAPVIGKVFKIYENLKNNERFKYVYIATIFSLTTNVVWMSFTGFFAKIKYFPIFMIFVVLIIRKKHRKG